jgi:protein-S-isoprenylcysteine O-methyltransferase Ste14
MPLPRLIVGIVINVAIFACLLFVPAGTLAWGRAWTFLAVVAIGTLASTLSIARLGGGLLEERFKLPIQEGQPRADKIIVSLLIAEFLGLIAVIPLDVFRLHLMREPPTWVSSCGLVLFILGWWIMTLALRENAFAAPAVRHQQERRQTVVDSGLYGWVRHPMYAGAIPLLLGMPLWLGSYAGALLALAPIFTLAGRSVVEERFLTRELKGYDAYTQRTRYRLIPFLW